MSTTVTSAATFIPGLTVLLTHHAGPFEAGTHFNLTLNPATGQVRVVHTAPAEANIVLHDVTVHFSLVNRSIVGGPTDFTLRVGRFHLPIHRAHVDLIRTEWLDRILAARSTVAA